MQWAGKGRVESTAVTAGASSVNRQGNAKPLCAAAELKAQLATVKKIKNKTPTDKRCDIKQEWL